MRESGTCDLQLNEVDEGATGDKTSYAKEAAGGARTNREADEQTGGDAAADKSDARKKQSEGGKVRFSLARRRRQLARPAGLATSLTRKSIAEGRRGHRQERRG